MRLISFDEAGTMLEEIAMELPREIYIELNGGINLLPDTKMHPASKNDDLFILGEYHCDRSLGRFINIYFGSFMALYASLPPEAQREKLKDILKHEFTHHLESMAGEHDLDREDAQAIARYYYRGV